MVASVSMPVQRGPFRSGFFIEGFIDNKRIKQL